uniref:Uncharacterized protein n=1 Tax=Anguilla anguilla TaxID=7936 RepID=A0A0E9X4V0_ANGAN
MKYKEGFSVTPPKLLIAKLPTAHEPPPTFSSELSASRYLFKKQKPTHQWNCKKK